MYTDRGGVYVIVMAIRACIRHAVNLIPVIKISNICTWQLFAFVNEKGFEILSIDI